MQSFQPFDQTSDVLHINTQPLNCLVLQSLIQVDESLYEFTVHESEWLVGFADLVLESAVFGERDVARGLDELGKVGLERHEEILMFRRDESEKVNRPFDLEAVSKRKETHTAANSMENLYIPLP